MRNYYQNFSSQHNASFNFKHLLNHVVKWVLKLCSALTHAYDLILQWKWVNNENKLLNKLNADTAAYIRNTEQMEILWIDTVFQFSVQVGLPSKKQN